MDLILAGKYAVERRRYGFDFSQALPPGSVIASKAATVRRGDVILSGLAHDGLLVTLWIAGGRYRAAVDITVTTQAGEVVNARGLIEITP